MKLIGITQRVDFVEGYNEKRDAIDQKWNELFYQCGLMPILLSNNIHVTKQLLKQLDISGFLLTGGNSLVKYGGDAPERDVVERFCIEYAIENDIPLLGVCRGMQVIQDYFHIKLKPIKGHVKNKQTIFLNNKEVVVNSYHNWGTMKTTTDLNVFAKSVDGTIKGIEHEKYKVKGIMWHPERIAPFEERDIILIKEFYK